MTTTLFSLPSELRDECARHVDDVRALCLAARCMGRSAQRALYGDVCVASDRAPLLIDALIDRRLGELVRRVRLDRPVALDTPRGPRELAALLRAIISLAPNLVELRVDAADQADGARVFDKLPIATRLRMLTVVALPKALSTRCLKFVGRLPELRRLVLSGLHDEGLTAEHDALANGKLLPAGVRSLDLDHVGIGSDAFARLTGHLVHLTSIALDLPPIDVDSPSDDIVLEFVRVNRALQRVRITRAWSGPIGGDPAFGRRLIDACGPSVRHLALIGEILDATTFHPSPVVKNLRCLTLVWYRCTSYCDVLALIQSTAVAPSLVEVSAHNEGFDGDDRGHGLLPMIRQICDRRGIKCSVGALFGCVGVGAHG